MYKKVIVTKNINDDASVLNDTIREKIKDFMVLNGWTLDTSKSHGCNYCLYKDFSSQNNSTSLNYWTPPTFEYLYSGSGSTFSQNDPNGEFHFSISKPLHNSRVISIYPFENPSTRFGSIENRGSNIYQGYNASDTEITKLCTQDSAGYTDSGDRYDTDGYFSGVGALTKSFTTSRWSYASSPSYNMSERYYKFNGEIRIDDNVEEVTVEMFYFTDTDLQEEFYFVIKADKMFGRLSTSNNRFYQTVGFVKIPGLPLICSSTVYESTNALSFSTYGYLTQSFKVYTDSNGVKSFLSRFDEDGQTFSMNDLSRDDGCFINPVNMSTSENVSASFNPRFDAPDTTPDLWLHHTTGNYAPFLRFSYGAGKYGISYTDCDLANRHHPLKIFGTCWCIVPWMKQTVNNIEHTIYGCLLCDNIFSSYEFLYDKSCSSQTGTSLIVPIQKQFQKYMYRVGPRHIKWYNMFYTVPEKVLNPTQDDISLTWKAYPCKRRSIQGYVNFTTQSFDNFVPWIHPVTKREFNGKGRTSQNNYSLNPPVADMFWFTEGDPAQSATGQSVLSDCQIGAELDASGPEGFAIDNSDYDASNIETVDLDI